MKDELKFLAAISVVFITLAFSACQQSSAKIVEIPYSPATSPKFSSPIRDVDFKNFIYSWTEDLSSDDEKTFVLQNGRRPLETKEKIGVSFVGVDYGDVTGDGVEEAFVNLSVGTGGSSQPNMIYVYTLENQKPKLLWNFETGDRAEGGFKKIYAEDGKLVVETFGKSEFEDGKWKFDIPEGKFKGLCCPSVYTKIRFKWNGEKFVVAGAPEIFDYERKNKPTR